MPSNWWVCGKQLISGSHLRFVSLPHQEMGVFPSPQPPWRNRLFRADCPNAALHSFLTMEKTSSTNLNHVELGCGKSLRARSSNFAIKMLATAGDTGGGPVHNAGPGTGNWLRLGRF